MLEDAPLVLWGWFAHLDTTGATGWFVSALMSFPPKVIIRDGDSHSFLSLSVLLHFWHTRSICLCSNILISRWCKAI